MGDKAQAIAAYLQALGAASPSASPGSGAPPSAPPSPPLLPAVPPDPRRLFKVVLTGGVFDLIHPGHLHTLEQAKKEGDVLVVVVAADENVERRKGRPPLHTADERAALVGALKPVDMALVGVSRWQDTLARVGPDVVVFGYDQKPMELPSGIRSVHLQSHGANPNSKTGKVRDTLGL